MSIMDRDEHYQEYQECLMAMKRARQENLLKSKEMSQELQNRMEPSSSSREDNLTSSKAIRGSIIASMVPDEIILQHSNYSVRHYETALMFIDVSGFTDLCERYTKADRGGPSRLTQVLNAYIGAMVQEILSHGGDVLNFSGDAFLSMWKKSPIHSLQSVVHSAIDCGLSVQKNYGSYHTDVGVVLKVKIAISAGISHFALIGDAAHSHYVILGQPVWDVKIAQNISSAGDVITAASAWLFANETKYIAEPLGDGRHTRVLRTGVTWKSISHTLYQDKELFMPSVDPSGYYANYYREFSLRPVMVSALRRPWWSSLSKFMVKPVMWAVENDEPMEFLTEIRRVVIVFLNIITSTVTDEVLVDIVNTAFKCVDSISSESDGLLNKVSMFDKDLMFLLIFGLRGITHEDDAQQGLLCAQTLKESLVDPNIISVSIGITSGTTYCGVVGHVLRREYTVIGSAVNKAARLMMAYPNKVTCDKEVFLRSKMNQQFFRLLEFKPMKGIKRPGPVYEFNKNGWPEWQSSQRHPLLGRDKELRAFILALQKSMKDQMFKGDDDYKSLNEDHVFGVVILGPKLVGKTRLIEECIHLTPNCVRVVRITLSKMSQVPYGLFRQIALKTLSVNSSNREELEHEIEASFDISRLSTIQVYSLNLIFNCHFDLPERFEFTGDILADQSVKKLLQEFLKHCIPSLWVVVIEESMYIDDESWRILLILLDSRTIFVIMSLDDDSTLSGVADGCLSTEKLLKMPLSGLGHRYHSALACQFLDVQAIPIDLEKIIQSASNGMPGWILNFIISLVQQGDLSVETETRAKALQNGAVLPPPSLLYRKVDATLEYDRRKSLDTYFEKVLKSLNADDAKSQANQKFTEQPDDFIQIAVLASTYEVFHVKKMSIDAMILKTYDSLAPFEKMLLKCGSVLGVVFSRHMMQYILQSDSQRKIAEAVAKLFVIEVLECQGGDFTQKTSKVLIHTSPDLEGAIPPYCSCLGANRPDDCADLPKYAFCGYIRFKHPLFRITIYELLTETQKLEMHARALFYLEFYTRRCCYCGSGCFHRFMGKRSNDGLMNDSDELRNTRRMIRELAAETKEARTKSQPESESLVDFQFRSTLPFRLRSDKAIYIDGSEILHESISACKDSLSVRSFSSLDLKNCECLAIVMFVYDQIINHCRGAGEPEKLFESYLEYADLCVINLNTPLALRLLKEAEGFVMNDTYWSKIHNKIHWLKDIYLGRIMSLRGHCMLEIGEHIEARKHLYRALELFCDPFPTTKCGQMIRNIQASFRQWRTLKIAPKASVGKERYFVAYFYEDVAVALTRLYKLFTECKEYSKAELAAKWSLIYARRNNANFQLLCASYGNMISIHLKKHEFSKCVELEKLAMDVCRRKRGMLDAAEIRAVCVLYTSVFSFYVENAKKDESLAYGLPVLKMVSKLTDPGIRVRLIIWVLNLLLSDLRIAEIILLMKEPLHLDDHDQYDLSSTVWYYFYSMVVLIETGYSVESYHKCEQFYLSNGDTILRSKSKEAAWYYFSCMWLITVRVGAWERSVLWEEKVTEIMCAKEIEYNIYMQLLLLEGLLITLVRQIDSRNTRKVIFLRKTIKNMFRTLGKRCQKASIYLPRYLLLLSYFCQIRGEKLRADSYLEKTLDLAKGLNGTLLIWAEHTRQHWTGTLATALEDYWAEHVEPDDLLDYQDFSDRKQIIPYTLPLPNSSDG